MVLPMEWRDVWRGTETECVRSVEADIFHLRSQLIEVSPDNSVYVRGHRHCQTSIQIE